MKIKLSLIIPVYNADSFIINKLNLLSKWESVVGYDVEIIIVNDGSKDLTLQLIEDYIVKMDSTFTLISYDKNKGKGFAVKTGMLEAKGEYRIFTDADIPFGFEIIDSFLYYLDFKEFDCVIGDRTLPDSNYFTEIAKIRKIGSSIFSFIVGRFVSGGYFDTQCGIKGFSANAANDLFSLSKINGFAFDVELLYISLKRNYDIKRLPVVLSKNKGSTINMMQHGLGMFIDLYKIKWNHLTKKYKQ